MKGNCIKTSIAAAIITLAPISAAAQSTTLSLQKFADGQPSPDSIIAMTPVDGHFTLNNVYIPEDGFVLLATKTDTAGTTIGTYYDIPPMSAPIVYDNPNPLSISNGKKPIKVTPGNYDISFYTRDEAISSYNQMVITPTGQDGPFYPSRLYLMSATSQLAMIEGTDGIFTYQGDIPTGQFQISYEPYTGEPLYIYGPETAQNISISEDTLYPIAYGIGTKAYFSFDTNRHSDESYLMQISLPDKYIKIVSTGTLGVDNIECNDDSTPAKYYNLQGCQLPAAPDHGVYIKVSGSHAIKMAR